MAVVSVEGLSRRYGRHRGVEDVSFEVQDHEIVGLLGPNGSGKTTILRILTGYLQPGVGRVRVDGLDVVRDGRAARARIGYVPENAPLYGQMRVNEFLDFMGRLRGLQGPALRGAIAAACDRLALGPVAEAMIGRLSRGYRQRVAIAQALLHAPRLLVLDEPTNGLDPRQIIELRHLLRDLARDCSVLVTSHILAEMERVADRVAILLDGRLLTVHRIAREGRAAALRIRSGAEGAPAVAAALAALPPGVTAMEEPATGDVASWRLEVPEPEAALAALAAAGLASVEALPPASGLEELFLRLTAGKAVH
ncbi:ABC transporter ATP-binding protein [Paracraurococcus lichenis]|uniref:ABC transporter ATP-binding protein n=1 Tax=Paracraurococcus lichenis TaxID=3064888 RepID=A0ABT9DT96_9PROT|nr:ABC transporter ATP-binding protein [Paracraurococcus sp. LOR1-02]MDO9707114.1 ABC transporter ATP-binding protein [Paracraurococcus sp. LOR1-02]